MFEKIKNRLPVTKQELLREIFKNVKNLYFFNPYFLSILFITDGLAIRIKLIRARQVAEKFSKGVAKNVVR